MPATTPRGFPYPLPTEPVAEGAQAIRNLADYTDTGQSVAAATTQLIANLLAAGHTQPAFKLSGDGKHEWGPGGSGALDTNLYRAGGAVLKTDGQLQVGTNISIMGAGGFLARAEAVASNTAFGTRVTGDTGDRVLITSGGALVFGSGTGAGDLTVSRFTASGTTVCLSSTGPVRIGNYTVATIPAANQTPPGALIYVSDAAAGAKFQGCIGTSWVSLG